jgi:DNA-binding winged helix-turn-helix (wHTH) protein
MKINYLFGTLALSVVVVVCAFAGNSTSKTDFDLAKQEIVLRKIGHEILLHAGDSTSRIPPVKKIAANEYQLQFENPFTFEPDSLVSIVKRSLSSGNITTDYIVNVLNCSNTTVVFGYAILSTEKNDIIPCSGRAQSKSCYLINLKFQEAGITAGQKGLLMGGLLFLALTSLLFFRKIRSRKKEITVADLPTEPAVIADTAIQIGNTVFDATKRSLVSNSVLVELTAKENKLLLMFAQALNQVIDRSRLQKEIWEDEGVIVGRSLDMFISKLRKKLEHDPAVKLVNIHGKGYKLEVVTASSM